MNQIVIIPPIAVPTCRADNGTGVAMLIGIIDGFIIVAAGVAVVCCLFLSRLRKAREEHQKLNLDGQ